MERIKVEMTPHAPNDIGAWYGQGPEGDDTENGWGATFALTGLAVHHTEPPLVVWRWNPDDGFWARILWYGDTPESRSTVGHTDIGGPTSLARLRLRVNVALTSFGGDRRSYQAAPVAGPLPFPGSW
jgi:hypothetical protein